MFSNTLVVIKGAGDLASGIAIRLFRCGFPIIMTEIARPMAVRRSVSFADAVFNGETKVESIPARRWTMAELSALAWQDQEKLRTYAIRQIPVVVDPEALSVTEFAPIIVIDAVMAKQNLGTQITDAPIVIGIGPGFSAGSDCHAVIETKRGHNLGRVIWTGPAQEDTGQPGELPGIGVKRSRVLRATVAGHIVGAPPIGKQVCGGDTIADVIDSEGVATPIVAPFDGILRGIIHSSVSVTPGMKIGDVDPRIESKTCLTVSDKSLAIAGGALEAILATMNHTELG
jgi:xanthine dehydrogenase accessory factor